MRGFAGLSLKAIRAAGYAVRALCALVRASARATETIRGMMLAGIPVTAAAVDELADLRPRSWRRRTCRLVDAPAAHEGSLLRSIDERAIILGQLEDLPDGLSEPVAC